MNFNQTRGCNLYFSLEETISRVKVKVLDQHRQILFRLLFGLRVRSWIMSEIITKGFECTNSVKHYS